MNSNECVTFILRTADLPTYASGANEKGSSNNSSHSSFSWNNIDLRAVLGEMWYLYDYFNIALVSCVSGVGAPTYASNDSKIGVIYMSGPRWKSNYDTGSKTFTANAPIGMVNFSSLSATLGTVQQFNTLSFTTFGKYDPMVNINIFYKRISDNTPNVTATGTFPAMTFLFKIYGVKLGDKMVSQRMELRR